MGGVVVIFIIPAVPGIGDVAQLVEYGTSMLLRLAQFLGVARDFSPRVSFQCGRSYGVQAAPVCNCRQ